MEEATSAEITDIALHFDYKWNDYTGMLRAGPMKASQGRDTLLNSGNIAQLFNDPRQDSSLSDLCGSIPEAFLFLELDVFSINKGKRDKWIPFVEEVTSHIKETFDKIIALVLECHQ